MGAKEAPKIGDRWIPVPLNPMMEDGLGADSEEKREPASDSNTDVVDSLKVLDPERPIREADTDERPALLDAIVRARIPYESFGPPYLSGLLTREALGKIIGAIIEERTRNELAAEDEQRRDEVPIIKMAKDLGLNPLPAGHNKVVWIAKCPSGPQHWIEISASENQFGCGYCRRKGGPAELGAFYDFVQARSTDLASHSGGQ